MARYYKEFKQDSIGSSIEFMGKTYQIQHQTKMSEEEIEKIIPNHPEGCTMWVKASKSNVLTALGDVTKELDDEKRQMLVTVIEENFDEAILHKCTLDELDDEEVTFLVEALTKLEEICS